MYKAKCIYFKFKKWLDSFSHTKIKWILKSWNKKIFLNIQCWNCPILGGGLGFWILWSTCRRTKFANNNPARAQPRFKSWGVWIGRSPNRGREAPEIWGWSPNRGWSPRKSGERGLGRGLGEPLPRKFLEFRTSNRSIWCIVEKGIRK